MLKVTELGVECKVQSCNYHNNGWCMLNTKAESSIITETCASTNNWYITGSFVLDKVFKKTTARDIDLVIFENEKPKTLPAEILESPLIVETLWITGDEPHNMQYHNISLPRITNTGLVGWEIASALASTRTLSVLPRVRRLPASTMFWAVKPIVKYDLNMDAKCFQIWNKSLLNPIAWRALTLRLIEYGYFEEDSFDWDMLKANHLIYYLEQAFKYTNDSDKEAYLKKLLEIMRRMDFSSDRGCSAFLQYVHTLIIGDENEQKAMKESMRSYKR